MLANVDCFSIENLHIVKQHGWGISLEACTNGSVRNIDFDACMYKVIDGIPMNMENQDGIDIRNGCHHIVISDITGQTGDDLIALTAIVPNKETYLPGGSLRTTHVMHNDWSRRERDIHDIVIRNVIGCSYLCWVLRLLAANTKIYNVVADGIIDTNTDANREAGTILLGDNDDYATNLPDSIRGVTISNVVTGCKRSAIALCGYMCDSAITNVVNREPNCGILKVSRPDGMKNVSLSESVSVKAK